MNYVLCFRYHAFCADSDPDEIYQFVLRHGGWLETGPASIDFYLPEQYESLLRLAWPGLQRLPVLDYLV